MEFILSTAFGVQAETQTVENDPITEKAKKALAPNSISALMSQYKACFRHHDTAVPNLIDWIKLDFSMAVARRLKSSRANAVPNLVDKLLTWLEYIFLKIHETAF